ncbi:MAG: PTS glucose transporter subunit IIA [Gordonia sp. (in: high G+C Gram-positive bacteria)]
MTTNVLAPLAGTVVSLEHVPDEVFAAQLVGSGVAIEPADTADDVEVLAPVSGRILKLHPHAFVILRDDAAGVLVHIGIDTVKLRGEGFTVHAEEKSVVSAGQPIITFNPAKIRAQNLSAVCPVVIMDTAPRLIPEDGLTGRQVVAGEDLFDWIPRPGTGR